MDAGSSLPLGLLDYLGFASFFVALSIIGYVKGRKEQASSQEYFLAGRKLPWYVVGCSFIASNISSEHFIGMIGASFIYGTCICVFSWANIGAYSFLIWLFIPFLLASRVFTIPEFLEKRFTPGMRQFFAIVTVISNVVAFLAAVLYGGALALQSLFGWPFWPALIGLAIVAGAWAIYGGLSSVAWTDFFTVIVVCAVGSLATKPPRPEQVTSQFVFHIGQIASMRDRGRPWYTSVLFWWLLFAGLMAVAILAFSGLITW